MYLSSAKGVDAKWERREAAMTADRRSGLMDIATPLWSVSERVLERTKGVPRNGGRKWQLVRSCFILTCLHYTKLQYNIIWYVILHCIYIYIHYTILQNNITLYIILQYTYIYTSLSLSLSLYTYIYIHTYVYVFLSGPAPRWSSGSEGYGSEHDEEEDSPRLIVWYSVV